MGDKPTDHIVIGRLQKLKFNKELAATSKQIFVKKAAPVKDLLHFGNIKQLNLTRNHPDLRPLPGTQGGLTSNQL